MSLLTVIKENALTIAIIVVVLAIGSSVYDRFFSDRAQLIKELQKQISEREQQVAELDQRLAQLTEEEQARLQEIASLKTKFENIQQLIQHGERKIDEIKDELISLDEALETIEDHTRRAVDRGRGLPAAPDSSAGK